jgi:hypothetical protein
MALTAFTRNHADRCTDKGYQFEFFCDSCGAGVRSGFQPNSAGHRLTVGQRDLQPRGTPLALSLGVA